VTLKNAEEYLESIDKIKYDVYIDGKKVSNPLKHPLIVPAVNSYKLLYQMQHDELYKPLMVTKSDLISGEVSRFLQPYRSIEDMVVALHMLRVTSQALGSCVLRCLSKEILVPLYHTTFHIDKQYGTDYHKRFINFLKYVQQEDLSVAVAMTDVKGDRSLPPHSQPNKFVRIVEKRSDGIIVRGAKMHITGVVGAHAMVFLPSQVLDKEDSNHAVAFWVPTDTENLKLVLGRHALDDRRYTGSDYGNIYDMNEYLVILNDVFVPWDNVFMCGEYEATRELIRVFSASHRFSYGACRAGVLDLLTGACAQIAEFHGYDRASHIRDKLTDMIIYSETLWACAIAAAYLGQRLSSGVYIPNPILANVTKYHTATLVHKIRELAIDITGGIIGTMPSELNLENEEIGKYVEEYLSVRVDARKRMKLVRFIEFLTHGVMCVADHFGGGGPQTQRVFIRSMAPFEYLKCIARIRSGIEVESPKSTFGYLETPSGVLRCCSAYGSENCPLTRKVS
jgi:4-hydroxybutyryl-CoA dehydratase/vinylacetyl-CoA-Delta-isomerase